MSDGKAACDVCGEAAGRYRVERLARGPLHFAPEWQGTGPSPFSQGWFDVCDTCASSLIRTGHRVRNRGDEQ